MRDFYSLLRRKFFWVNDSIFNSGKVYKNLNEIKKTNTSTSLEECALKTEENIKSLLKHAVANTKFYKCYDSLSLNDFPIINKSIIKSNEIDFLTNTKTKLKSVTTSGSTGYPLTIYQDQIKINRHKADMIYSNQEAGLNLGDKLYYFRVWNTMNRKNAILGWLQNIKIVDISNFSNNKIFELINEMKKDKGSKSVLSFSSALEILEKNCSSNPEILKDLKLTTIIAMSESLPVHTRSFLSASAACPVVSRYSNMENGFIAQQRVDSDEYYINHASFYVEILNLDNNQPAPLGKFGRIVVTDLFNYGMPLIRYDTGDIAIKAIGLDNKIVIKSIEGRKTDFIYNTKGEILSPHTITNTMWYFSKDVFQFQFIQHDKIKYEMKLNLVFKQNGIDKTKLMSLLKGYLGEDSEILITIVDEIPVLDSGKRKKIINNWNSNV